jgi:hypothetical protein
MDNHNAMRVCEKFQLLLTRFAGADSFISLLRRALALASKEFPALAGVKVSADGHMERFEELVAKSDANEAAVAVIAHLLWLLINFIGEPLTVKLVREAWPDVALDDLD